MTLRTAAICLTVAAFAFAAHGQKVITVYDPTSISGMDRSKIGDGVNAIEKVAATAAKSIPEDACRPEVEVAGTTVGAFTRAGAKQKLVFYQYCQTGNGFGWVGLVLFEGDKVVGHFISEAGWSNDIGVVADVNRNGLDEFTLVYSGGMHQGQGGTGVDLMEFAGGVPKGLGWYKAEEYDATEASNAWKLTAKPGPTPRFYTQKYFTGENNKYKPVGKTVPAKLGRAISKFKAVK